LNTKISKSNNGGNLGE